MTTVSIEEFRADVDKYLNDATNKDVVLTNKGKPWLVLRAVEPEAVDSTAFAQSPEFWKMIHERRQEQGIPWERAKEELGLDEDLSS